MLVFVDESGCSGFKIGRGSSQYFAVTATIFTDRNEARRCDESFPELRERLGLKQYKEFHFSKDRRAIRSSVLEHLAQFDFQYSAFVVNKAKLTGIGFRYKGSFYKYPIKLLFGNIKSILDGAIVVYDKCGDRQFISDLGSYLKRAMRNADGTQTAIKKFRAEQSKSNNLIQMADFVCGAVMWSMHEERRGHMKYRNIIIERELCVQFWPK